jgi:FHS family L-fucose permease-like MFS transporter
MQAGKQEHLPSTAFPLLTLLFFMWGFITCLNDILVPHFKAVFQLSFFESSLVQFAFFGAYFFGSLVYFLFSLSGNDPIAKIGYRNGIRLGLLISAMGTLMFLPAASMVSFGFFLSALFCLALGLTLLQVAANPFAAILGKPETASQRLNMAQALNSLGTTLAPLIGGAFILADESVQADIKTVETPYLLLGICFLALLLLFSISKLPEYRADSAAVKGIGALRFPQLALGVPAIFFYVGAEVSTGSFLTSYAELPGSGGFNSKEATAFVSLYWGSLMIGRFTGTLGILKIKENIRVILSLLIPFVVFLFLMAIFAVKGIEIQAFLNYWPWLLLSGLLFWISGHQPGRLLWLFALAAMLLIGAGVVWENKNGLWCIIAAGLFNSVMWPLIFTLAIQDLREFTSQGSSLLVMAILGGALIPPLQGWLADQAGLRISYLVPAVCMLYLVFYGFMMDRKSGKEVSLNHA